METIISLFNIPESVDILAILGFLIATSFLASKVFQYLGIPQVVGFIVAGVLLGTSFLNVIPLELSDDLTFISEVALGLIGFDMGGHLRFGQLRRMGRSIFFILIFESLVAFTLVSAGIYALTSSIHTALIFGAISSATAPAATVEVLAEYDAQGPLTTSLLAVIGLDDAISLLLFSLAAAASEAFLLGSASLSFWQVIEYPLFEIGGSILLGAASGLLLNAIMHRMKSFHDSMAISIGFVFLCVGLSQTLGLSLILTSMVMGLTVVNREPEHGKRIRFTIEQAGPVIYVLFFTLVGARFQLSLLPTMGLLGIAYVLLRSIGKFSGAWLGGTLGRAEPTVRDNIGLGLLTQGGVAIGLALNCQCRFAELGPEGDALGTLVLAVITATTFIVEIIGPIGVKIAIRRAGEIGKAKFSNGWIDEPES